MKNTPCFLLLLVVATLAGCQKEYSIDTLGGTDSTGSPILKKMSIYTAGNVADGDDTLVCTYYSYDAQNRFASITDSAFNKDGARFIGSFSFVYNGASKYPTSLNAVEKDDQGEPTYSSVVLEYNNANQLIKESHSTGETKTYTYHKNLVIVQVENKSTPGVTGLDSAFYDDKHNVIKEIAWAMELGTPVTREVVTNTYSAYVDPLHAYGFPPFNALQSFNLALTSATMVTDLSTGQSTAGTINYHYAFDSKGRVITITFEGSPGKITYEYY